MRPEKNIGIVFVALLFSAICLSGCSSYKLQGTVIEGAQSHILVVDQSDSRLQQRGLGGVHITITQSPMSLGRKQVGEGLSNGRGQFSIPISSFGAGFLEYQMGIVARRKAHVPAQKTMQLPGSDKRLLIILSQGANQINNRHTDTLRNALEESQPYLH